MSRNKMYDEILDNIKSELVEVYYPDFGIINNLEVKHSVVSLLDRMKAVYEAKDSDYSENDLPMGNLIESLELGIEPWKGVLLRIGDKKRRIGSFVKKLNFQVKDEAVDDTLVDMSNYAMLGYVLWKQKYQESSSNVETEYAWKFLAKSCIITKILFENRESPNIDRWTSSSGWGNILKHYDTLAQFARNN